MRNAAPALDSLRLLQLVGIEMCFDTLMRVPRPKRTQQLWLCADNVLLLLPSSPVTQDSPVRVAEHLSFVIFTESNHIQGLTLT